MYFLLLYALLSFPLTLCALQADVSARAAILMNARTGKVLWEKNAHLPLQPASTTKMITALYAMERKGDALDALVLVSPEAVAAVSPAVRRAPGSRHPPYRLEFGGTHMGLQVGEQMTLLSLLEGLLLVSANDAANVIAEFVSSDIEQFMREINLFVRSKGCLHTELHTPHGLPCAAHVTTAHDMALLARAFLEHDTLRRIGGLQQSVRPSTNKQPETPLVQYNGLIKPGRFFYPKAIGIKTGYTVAAGYCLVAAAEDQGRELIAVVLGCDQLAKRYQDAMELFEKAFQEPKLSRTLFAEGFDQFAYFPQGAKSAARARLASDVILEYYPSEEPVVTSELVWDSLALPIAIDTQVGSLYILSEEGTLILAAPLYAKERVESTWQYEVQCFLSSMQRICVIHRMWLMMGFGVCIVLCTYFLFSIRKRATH
jgi:D-alanyl-D-alanine carboxypeptidase (penicillin-binding protein 5/6)